MSPSSKFDHLETDFGTAILSELTGQFLIRNQQPVRLFDTTQHSAEYYFRSDKQGKPYIQDFALSKRYYPITAYSQVFKIPYQTALSELCQQYGLNSKRAYRHRLDQIRPVKLLNTTYLPVDLYQLCRIQIERNGFYQYLCYFLGQSMADQQIERYCIGTSHRWQYEHTFATCFPQFDIEGNLRQIKVMPFHPITGRRARTNDTVYKWNERNQLYELDSAEKVWFAGKKLTTDHITNLQQCYFGEHLLRDKTKPVAIVEGESTAIVCSAIWPQYIWIATGGSTGGKWYNPDRFSVLSGREVVIWPDSGKYEEWRYRAQPLRKLVRSLMVSRYLEDKIPFSNNNVDLRDLLTWPRFILSDGTIIYGEKL
ncbi:hypothetical protein GO755_40430 [Spirosoma sp. HMF4905]|uniref:DUF6371 domain-containing protein n=1 Tax=Spirosoma arboris TaxID=2682092 RepID=A0A7K1SRH2_9BACT|nr:DUF6371 domain-containing protein [Spirosoma arboris]MVM36340.1 hypothetical protein [Spirosoma arboris]